MTVTWTVLASTVTLCSLGCRWRAYNDPESCGASLLVVANDLVAWYAKATDSFLDVGLVVDVVICRPQLINGTSRCYQAEPRHSRRRPRVRRGALTRTLCWAR